MISKTKVIITICILLASISVKSQEVVTINDLLADTAFMDKLPIPMASITFNIEETRLVIEEVKENLGLSPEQLDRIDSLLNTFTEEQSKYQDQITEEFLNSSSTILLDKTISDLEQSDERVNYYREVVQTEILKKEEHNKKIDNLLVIWDVTYKAERSTELSDVVKDNLMELIDTLKKTDKEVDAYLNNLLELELALNEFHNEFDILIKQIKKARGEATRNLLIPDSDPIWIIYTAEKDTVQVKTMLIKVLQNHKDNAIEYCQNNRNHIYLAVFIILLIQLLFYIIRFRILKEQIEDPEKQDNAVLKLFRKPFSPALLVGLYATSIMLPQKPLIIGQLLYFAGLIPFTILLINLILRKNRWLIVYFSFIFALSIFSELGYNIELFSRTFMLIITILTLVFVILVLNTEWKGLQDDPLLRKIIKFLVKLTFVILVICLIGNIVGNYTLTSILLYGVLSTVFLGISMFLFYLILIGFFEAAFESNWGQSYRIIKRYHDKILSKIKRVVTFILSVTFIIGTLNSFMIFTSIYDSIEKLLVTPYTIGNFTFSLNDILLFIFILLVASWISQFTEFILQEQVLFKSRKRKNFSASISSLVTFSIITIGFFIAALASGFPLDKLALLISAFGVGIGFGLQNIFNNLVSGIILVFERPLEVGDTIEVGHLLGVVKKIGIRASTVRTFDGSEVIVPNGNLISNELINWTHSDSQRRLIIKVGVAYGTDPNEVIKILLGVAKKNKELLEDPEPYVLFKEFGDSALGFELRCFTESEDWLFILSDLHVKVNDAISKAGMVIPFPQRDLHIKTMDQNIVKSVKSTTRTK